MFAPDDLVLGPSAGGELRAMQQRLGGGLLTDLPKPTSLSWLDFAVQSIVETTARGSAIHFDVTHVLDVAGVLDGAGWYAPTVTGHELRFIRDRWPALRDQVKFYRDDIEIVPDFVQGW